MRQLTQLFSINSYLLTINFAMLQSKKTLVEASHFSGNAPSTFNHYSFISKTSFIVLKTLFMFLQWVFEKLIAPFYKVLCFAERHLIPPKNLPFQIKTIKQIRRQTEKVSPINNLIIRESFSRLICTFN